MRVKDLSREKLLEACNGALSMRDVSRRLGAHDRFLSPREQRRIMGRFGIDIAELVEKNRNERPYETRTCKKCGREFTGKYSEWCSGEFCSKECAHSYVASLVNGKTKAMKCYRCGKEITADVRVERKLCPECKKQAEKEASARYLAKKFAMNNGTDPERVEDIPEEVISKLNDPSNGTRGSRAFALELKKSGRLPEWILVDKYGLVSVDREKLNNARQECVKGAVIWEPKRFVKSSKGHIYASVPGHPRAIGHDYVYLHNIVVENMIGRVLDTREEVVHHVNLDAFDNRFENLKVMSRKEHALEHGKIDSQNTIYIEFKCPWCGGYFLKMKSGIPKGRTFTACSPHCRGKISVEIQNHRVSEDLARAIAGNRIREGALSDLLKDNPDIEVK